LERDRCRLLRARYDFHPLIDEQPAQRLIDLERAAACTISESLPAARPCPLSGGNPTQRSVALERQLCDLSRRLSPVPRTSAALSGALQRRERVANARRSREPRVDVQRIAALHRSFAARAFLSSAAFSHVNSGMATNDEPKIVRMRSATARDDHDALQRWRGDHAST
jgi:hypothetical protein